MWISGTTPGNDRPRTLNVDVMIEPLTSFDAARNNVVLYMGGYPLKQCGLGAYSIIRACFLAATNAATVCFCIDNWLMSPRQVCFISLCGIFYYPWLRHQVEWTGGC